MTRSQRPVSEHERATAARRREHRRPGHPPPRPAGSEVRESKTHLPGLLAHARGCPDRTPDARRSACFLLPFRCEGTSMAYTHFERLSALDLSFLEIEDGASHMHIGAVAIFEGGPLMT